VLADQGLADSIIEALIAAGITTVEHLGEMTPEQLQEIPGIEPDAVEVLQNAVGSYYGQFETEQPAQALQEQSATMDAQDSSQNGVEATNAEKGE